VAAAGRVIGGAHHRPVVRQDEPSVAATAASAMGCSTSSPP
jgi:hypothetical protein